MTRKGHLETCPSDCGHTAAQCYHCGRYTPSHREMCPDHPQWRKLMPIMSQAEFDRLIPVGEWAYSERALPS